MEKLQLRNYQERAADRIVEQNTIGLFLDPGFGKTIATLKALEKLKHMGAPIKVLLLGPIRVVESVWRQEAELWDIDLTFSLVRGQPKERLAALRSTADVYLTNYEQIQWLFSQDKRYWQHFNVLVCDESTFLKSPKTSRWKTLKKYLKLFNRRIILTGTPVANSYLDLWTQIAILDMGKALERSFSKYRNTFFTSDYMGFKWFPNKGAEETIRELIEPLVFRMQSTDRLVEDPIISNVDIWLSPKEQKVYNDFEKEYIMSVEEEVESITALSAAALHQKLTQLSTGFIYDENKTAHFFHDKKFEIVKETVEELNGQPLIIVYKFKHEVARLKEMFGEDLTVLNEGSAEANIKKWNEGRAPILALHPKSGGHGINLQHGGHNMLMLQPLYSAEDFDQTVRRIARSGQKHVPSIRIIRCVNTVDMSIDYTLQERIDSATAFLNYFEEVNEQ